MSEIFTDRMTAVMDEEFVVFLIGMRINRPWKIHKWLPVTMAMSKMLAELYQHPDIGFVHQESWFGRTSIMVQYWRSFEQLEQYAKNKNSAHLPAWANFNKQIGSNGDVGIWHETYLSRPGSYENIYHNMPRFGLAKVGKHVTAAGNLKTASGRIAANKQ